MMQLKSNSEVSDSSGLIDDLKNVVAKSNSEVSDSSYLIDLKNGVTKGDPNESLREMGILLNTNISISISIPGNSKVEVVETEDNSAVIENASESYNLIKHRYFSVVQQWLSMTSGIDQSEENKERSKKIINLKNSMKNLIDKYEKIEIKRQTFARMDETVAEESEDEEGDMEDVVFDEADMLPILNEKMITSSNQNHCVKRNDDESTDNKIHKDDSRVKKKCKLKSEMKHKTEWSLVVDDRELQDPSSGHHHKSLITKQKDIKSSPSKSSEPSSVYSAFSDRKKKLLALAPKMPFDNDLYHWEDEKLPIPKMLPNSTEGHRFWCASELDDTDGVPVPEGSSFLRTRVIEFTGVEDSIDRSCNVRLPSGKLCPRKDKIKCPFHGIIFLRDNNGDCIHPEDAQKWQKMEEERKKNQVPDWQDPQLLRELKAATGVDLTMPKKGERKRKHPGPGLTKLNKLGDTPVERIKKKIFNPKTLRRVAASINKREQRKFNDKYGDQFHYM